MTSLVAKLMDAQKQALSLRPKIGGFPVLAAVLYQAGVELNRWSLPSCQSIYLLKEGSVVQQGTPLVSGCYEIPIFNPEALIAALRADQEGRGTFAEFLKSSWSAGVVSYDVDFINRKVCYYGARGESYVEEYPAVEVSHA